MWLLDARTQVLKYFVDEREQSYAILSHTWAEEEVTFRDITHGLAKERKGYEKVRYTCEQAVKDGLDWVWIDTLCINKESSAELSEAINSMYRWYEASAKCYVYLSDAHTAVAYCEAKRSAYSYLYHSFKMHRHIWDGDLDPRELQLHTCRWFSRGWTLQELIAPPFIDFFGPGWYLLGDKYSMLETLASITKIDASVLKDRDRMTSFSIATRMSWAAGRITSRQEDRAYSLLGIFDINMPLLYGEGAKAFVRLQEEIVRRSMDLSILAWNHGPSVMRNDLFAGSPDNFRGSCDVEYWDTGIDGSSQLTNKGLQVRLPLVHDQSSDSSSVSGVLSCRITGNPVGPLALRLERVRSGKADGDQQGRMTFRLSNLSVSSRIHIVRMEDLELAADALITITRDSNAKNNFDFASRLLSSRRRSLWMRFTRESLATTGRFQRLTDLRIEETSAKRCHAPEALLLRSRHDTRDSARMDDSDLFEIIQDDPHTAFVIWSVMRQDSPLWLLFGIGIRAIGNDYQTVVFYRKMKHKQYHHPFERSHKIGIDKMFTNQLHAEDFVSSIPDWVDVIVKAEKVHRMGSEVFSVDVVFKESSVHESNTHGLQALPPLKIPGTLGK